MNKFSNVMSKVSIRMRLTIFITFLLIISSIALTSIINYSAIKMATGIEASIAIPSIPLSPSIKGDNPIAEDMLPTQHISQAKRSFFSESFLAMLLVIAGGAFFTWYIAGKTLAPVKDLSVQIQTLTVNNLSKEITVPPSNDEIADLTESFNEMTSRISKAFESQQRFSASAAHELRTPLAVLQTKVDVFRKKISHTTEEYEGLINVIATQTQRLSHLINDLLHMTNVDETEINEKVYLSIDIADIIEDLKPIADKRGISLNLLGNCYSVYGNSVLLQRAFYNLIENAIKYNTPGGEVIINLANINNNSVITITDTGIGIPDDMKPHIFEPFFRVDKSRSRELGGAGLGLSMVKTILDKHNAIIQVKNNTPKGSTFEVILKNIVK